MVGCGVVEFVDALKWPRGQVLTHRVDFPGREVRVAHSGEFFGVEPPAGLVGVAAGNRPLGAGIAGNPHSVRLFGDGWSEHERDISLCHDALDVGWCLDVHYGGLSGDLDSFVAEVDLDTELAAEGVNVAAQSVDLRALDLSAFQGAHSVLADM